MLRGAAVRWLRRLSVRQYSLPVEASGAAAHVAGRVSRETSQDGESDVTGHRSFREANKMRTRTRVKTQLYNLLRSHSGPGNESWTVGPPHEAYWLLRSCGSDMFLETTATRMELAHTMWEEFKRRAPLPVGMYNSLLQVYLQNGHRFDVTEFLEGMQKDGVLPNQGTLVGMLFCCCDEGDIEGATRLLDQMRSLDMEISENIYAALINGHCRRGDMESARGMLAMMEENGLSPTATSYSALLCGHADRGDMTTIRKLLEEMRGRRIFPSIGVYTAVMDRLSLSGHSELLPQALDLVHNKQLIHNDLYELACKSTMRRDDKGTLTILRCMATLIPASTKIHLGAILVRIMTTQARPLSEVMVMVSELQELGFGEGVYEEIVYSLHTREEEREEAMADAITVLQDMHRHGVVVKEHYFFPMLAFHAGNGDLDSATQCVGVMKEMGINLNRQAFQYLLQSVGGVGGASDSEEGVVSSNWNQVLEHLKGTPLSLSLVNEVCVYLIETGQFGHVPALLNSVTPESLKHGLLLKAIKKGVNSSKSVDVEGLVKLYVALHSLTDGPELGRSFGITTSILVRRSTELANHFLEELSKNGVDPGEAAYHVLLHSFATPETAKEFHELMGKMQSRGVELTLSVQKHKLELAANMGDPIKAGQAVAAIRRSGEKLSATAYSRYIMANTKSRRIGTALEIYERMRNQDMQPSYDAMTHLILELLRWGDIHGSENLHRDLEEMGYSPGSIIRNAFLGAYARRDMTKAVAEFEALKATKYVNSFTYNEIMVGYSLHGDTESIRKLFDEAREEGISLDRNLVSRLFEAHLTKGDIEGALSVIAEFPAALPHISSLVSALNLSVDRGDSEEIERVRDEVRKIYGDEKTVNVMFFAYVRSNQLTAAEGILENDGFVLDIANLISFMADMRQKRKVEQAYAALELLKAKGHHLGDDSSIAILRAYDMLGDAASAVALKAELQTAGLPLSEEFTRRLAAITKTHTNTPPSS